MDPTGEESKWESDFFSDICNYGSSGSDSSLEISLQYCSIYKKYSFVQINWCKLLLNIDKFELIYSAKDC